MLDEEDIKFLNSFIPKDTLRLSDDESAPLCQASDGDVARFINEQYEKRYLVDISYSWHNEWSYIQGQLSKGKPVLYKDKLINPVKLDLSKYKKEG